jgi:hypothetical protein
VAFAVVLHAIGAILSLTLWYRAPGSVAMLALGLGFFFTALGLWRMLAWARLLTVLALWLAIGAIGLGLLQAGLRSLDGAAFPVGLATGRMIFGGCALWTLRLLGKGRHLFHQRLI